MANVQCVRCKQDQAALVSPPFPGAMGEKIKTQVCETCWKEWMTVSTKIINEYRLQLFRPEHRKVLEDQMKQFLTLPD